MRMNELNNFVVWRIGSLGWRGMISIRQSVHTAYGVSFNAIFRNHQMDEFHFGLFRASLLRIISVFRSRPCAVDYYLFIFIKCQMVGAIRSSVVVFFSLLRTEAQINNLMQQSLVSLHRLCRFADLLFSIFFHFSFAQFSSPDWTIRFRLMFYVAGCEEMAVERAKEEEKMRRRSFMQYIWNVGKHWQVCTVQYSLFVIGARERVHRFYRRKHFVREN